MRIVCIGDSLTEGDYGVYKKACIANVHKENYPFFLSKLSGADVINYGHCGRTPTTYYQTYCQESQIDVTKADYILIMLGTNGGMNPEVETQGNIDYNLIIDYCIENNKDAKIVLITPPHATEDKNYSNYGCFDNVKKSAETVRKISKARQLPLIDLFAFEGISEKTTEELQYNDGLHFIMKGYLVLAAYIYGSLCELYADVIEKS